MAVTGTGPDLENRWSILPPMTNPDRRTSRWVIASFLCALVGFPVLAWLADDRVPDLRAAGALTCVGARGAGHGEEAAPDHGPTAVQGTPAPDRAHHLGLLGVPTWHGEGYRGQGIKIAVLDSGFRGFRSHLGAALPKRVVWQSFRADGDLEARDSQHGILCGEVLHALAPEAELLFANWEPDRPDQFLQAVRWARGQGARILSCSLIMPSWSDGEGGGAVNDALAEILGPGDRPGDVLCFASAGNTALRHWAGPFHAGPDGFHEWDPGRNSNSLSPWGTDPVSVELYGQPAAQYELRIVDATNGREPGRCSYGQEGGRGWSVVRFTPKAGASYRVQVRLRRGQAGPFHLVALGANLGSTTAVGSICCPADNPRVGAVGAVTSDGERAPYSSCGAARRDRLAPKPELVAPVPFRSRWRNRPFGGTSAAAPQAAGLAAVCWSGHPDWKPTQVRQALYRCARDLGPPGPDPETGFGQICLPFGGTALRLAGWNALFP